MVVIFGIPIDNLDRNEVQRKLLSLLDEPRFHRVATVNPEFLLLARKNKVFQTILREADLRIADGIGLSFPFWLSGEVFRGRSPGADLLLWLCERAEEKRLTIGLLLTPDGLSLPHEIRIALRQKFPHLNIAVALEEANIVFSNFGAPLQEVALEHLREKPSQIRLAMGVGGAFDYLTGKIPRAPKWFQKIGLEWLWRLFHQPKRWRRIWNAVIVFPIQVFCQK